MFITSNPLVTIKYRGSFYYWDADRSGSRMSLKGTTSRMLIAALLVLCSVLVAWRTLGRSAAPVNAQLIVAASSAVSCAILAFLCRGRKRREFSPTRWCTPRPLWSTWLSPVVAICVGACYGSAASVLLAHGFTWALPLALLPGTTMLGMALVLKLQLRGGNASAIRVPLALTCCLSAGMGLALDIVLALCLVKSGWGNPGATSAASWATLLAVVLTPTLLLGITLALASTVDKLAYAVEDGRAKFWESYGGLALSVALLWIFIDLPFWFSRRR